MKLGFVALAAAVLSSGPPPALLAQGQAEAEAGVFVQLVGVEVAPADRAAWEEILGRVADFAQRSGVPEDLAWLAYRADRYRYYLVLFGGDLSSLATPETYASALAELDPELLQALEGIALEVVDFSVTRMVRDWSTVDEMNVATHPMAHVVEYSIRPTAAAEADRLLRDFRRFYLDVGYPYPVEAFRSALFTPGRYMVVTFPDSWEAYHGANALDRLARDAGRAGELAALRDRLDALLLGASDVELRYAPELSFNP